MRILGISGSLRRGSHNRRLLRAAGDALPPGAVLVEWEGLAGLPAFDEDLEASPPEPVQDFLDAIEDADALLIATPEYNSSIPGALPFLWQGMKISLEITFLEPGAEAYVFTFG